MAEQTIDKISIEIKTRADESVKSIENLTLALAELQDYASPTATGLNQVKTALVNLNKPLTTMNRNYLSSSKNISKFANSLNELSGKIQNVQTGGFNKLVKGMKELSRINEYTKVFTDVKKDVQDFNRAIKTLDKTTVILPKIVQAFKDLDISPMVSNFSRLTSIMRPFNKAMGNASAVLKLFGSSLKVMPTDIDRMNKKISQLTQSTGRMESSLSKLASIESFRFMYDGISRMTQGIMGFVDKSMDYTETINLFNVAMGEYATKAESFINQLNKLGVDPAEATKMQGLFFQISESLGLTSEKAYALSENFTKLTYDLSSFFNIGTQEAFEKLRAGLVGETEPLRQLGIVITENNLAETARRLGIEQSIRTMTEAQKIELRYVTVLQQSINAHNDLERTILSPANAMRILKAEFAQTARAIGDLFIPILISVLPYITAFVRLIGQAVSALASFFGFEMPKIENTVKNTFGGVGEQLAPAVQGTENMGRNLDNATSSAKELKRQLMGFDELNVITSPSDTGGVGGGGIGGVGGLGGLGGFGDDLIGLDDFLSAGYDQLFLDISDNISKFMDKVKELAKTWIPILAGAFTGLMALKVYDWFQDLFDETVENTRGMNLLQGAINFLKNPLGTLKDLLMNPKFGIVAAFGTLAWNLTDVIMNSDNFRKTIQIIGEHMSNIKTSFPDFNAGWQKFDGFMKDIGVSGSTVVALLLGIGGAFLGVPFSGVLLGGSLTIGMFELLGKSMQTPIDKIDVFSEDIGRATKEAVVPFADSLRDMEAEIRLVNMDGIITEEEIATLQGKLTTITDSVINSLNADRNEELQSLDTLKHFMGEEEYAEAINRINTRYDGMITEIQSKNGVMLQTIRDFQEGRISEEEMYERIRLEVLQNIWNQGLTTFSESQIEMETIKRNASEQMSAIDVETAQQTLVRAKELKEEIIANAQDEFDRQVSIVSLKWDTMGKEEQDFYRDTLTKASKHKDDMIKNAETQYNELGQELKDGLGEQGKYLDIGNAELNNKYEAYWDGVETNTNNHHRILGTATANAMNNLNSENQKGLDKLSGSDYTMAQKRQQQYKDMFKEIANEEKSGNSVILRENETGIKNLIDETGKKLPDMSKPYKSVFDKDIKDEFSASKFRKLGTDSSGNVVSGARTGLTNNVSSLRTSIRTNFTNVFQAEINKVNNMKASLPKPDGGRTQGIRAFRIPAFARGGIPNVGSLFMAGERGSELIGKFGGRDTVMPLEDSGFVDAMYDAIFNAVSTAIEQTDSGDIILSVGEEELGRSAIKGINTVTNKVGRTLLKI